jgi:putative methyltransferase
MSRQYLNAGRAVDAVHSGVPLKAYCNKNKVGKLEYALIVETLKYEAILDRLFTTCNIDLKVIDVSPSLFKVMAYEMLFGSGKIQGGGAVKRRLLQYIDLLKSALQQELDNAGETDHSNLLSEGIIASSNMVRYVRVNQIKMSLKNGLHEMKKLYSTAVFDEHIPSLIILPPLVIGLGDHALVKNGSLIIQDKASCMPSQLLMDEWSEGDIIDACAAPGNKTSHLASLLHELVSPNSNFKITAFDRNKERYELLKSRMNQSNASLYVNALNENFLTVDVNLDRYKNVRSILCDPSCSGSGVVRDVCRVLQNDHKNLHQTDNDIEQNERLMKLQSFQISVIEKAMSFPNVQTVVYSTCSIHQVYVTVIAVII